MADAVIYARYSEDKQRDESIEDQVRVCREAAERAGDRIRKVYADRAVSGTAAIQRREFLRMVADAQQGGFSKVYVYKTDRFARNRYDAAIYRRKLREAGVSIEPVAEHIPEGPEGIILEALMEGMAEYYSANLSQQVKRGMEGNALRCHHNGVRVQGYRCMPDGSYEVDEEQAAVVRRIFGMYAGGMTFAEMADALNAEGLRTPQGRRYCKQTFGPILRNERYIGVYRWGSVRREGGMPAIVDPVLWADVQARLTGIRPHVYGRGELYGLTGRLFDADGNVYRGYSAHGWGGRKYSYYQCVATGDLVRKDALEEAVNRAAADLLCSDEGLGAGIVDAILAEQERLMGGEVESIRSMERRLSGIDGKISNLVDLAAEMGDARRVAAKIRALEDEKAALADEVAAARAGAGVVLDRDMVEYFLASIVEESAPEAVVSAFVSRVEIGPPEDDPDPDGPGGGGRRRRRGGMEREVTVQFRIAPGGRSVRARSDGGHQSFRRSQPQSLWPVCVKKGLG